jgi:hypothetical protein
LVESIVPSQTGIGACLNCRQLFLITPDTPNCYLCGRPPAYTLWFSQAFQDEAFGPRPSPAIPPPEQPAVLIGVTCPHCHGNIQLSISDSEIAVVPPPAPEPQEEEPESGLTPPLTSEAAEEGLPLSDSQYLDLVAGLEPLPPAEDRTTVLGP